MPIGLHSEFKAGTSVVDCVVLGEQSTAISKQNGEFEVLKCYDWGGDVAGKTHT